MKLEVGMYVRTKKGYIYKFETNNSMAKNGAKKYMANCSYNIIDILEEGDYVNGYYVSKIWEKDEITHYVDKTPIKRKEREIVIQAPSYGGIDILKNNNIKSIVTKEQFEQMAYKVEE